MVIKNTSWLKHWSPIFLLHTLQGKKNICVYHPTPVYVHFLKITYTIALIYYGIKCPPKYHWLKQHQLLIQKSKWKGGRRKERGRGVYVFLIQIWQLTPVFLPGKSHGWRGLVGWSPWSWERLDTTERLHFHFSLSCIGEGNGNPLQCSCLENPRDRGAWWAAVYGVT